MIEGGYILQPRIINESDISVAPPYVREIWNFLLREANAKDFKYNGNLIKRGQLFRTYEDIREGTKWFIGWRKMTYNENQTKKAMRFLRETQRITTQKELGGVLITICNYDYYQNPKNYERTRDGTNERTIEEPLKNQPPPDTNKNDKKSKKERKKNKDTLLSQVDESTLDQKEKKYYQVAISFWELVKSNLEELNISGSEVERAKFKTWTDPIRLLMEKDKKTIEEFREIFKFLQKDDFWKEQIRSTAKLRNKNKEDIPYFEVLLTKSRNEQKRKEKRESTERSSQSGVSEDYRRSIFKRLHNPKNPEAT